MLIDNGITRYYRGSDYGSSFSLLALKLIQQHTFDFDQFRTQEQVDRLNSLDFAWLNFLFDKKIVVTKDEFHRLLNTKVIDGLNNVNFDLFSAVIDGIINRCDLKEVEKLKSSRYNLLSTIRSDLLWLFVLFETKKMLKNLIALILIHLTF